MCTTNRLVVRGVVLACCLGQLMADEQPARVPNDQQTGGGWKIVREQNAPIPQGTTVAVRLIDSLSSDKNDTGDRFRASLDTPIVVAGETVAARGCEVVGRVVRPRKAGRGGPPAELVLEIVELVLPQGRLALDAEAVDRTGESSSTAGNVAAIGSAAALGTALGAIFGGGRGAAIGAAAGGAVGAGGTVGAKSKPIKLPIETVLLFRLRTPSHISSTAGERK